MNNSDPYNIFDMFTQHNLDTPISNTRPVYGDERTCANCIHNGDCWTHEPGALTPPNFTMRADWDVTRVNLHMRSVYGQICGSFSHRDPATRRYFNNAEDARRREAGEEREWDREDN